ncbi:MAG: type II toxin-antitoxin system PemK/MazF family toxin [Devosia sp.]|nr:type II toxin-antitoxin system PemK/MazF family toxin [Devosia sp.]
MVRKHAPDRGDIYHLNLSPSAGREQAGPHYAVVISGRDYNAISGMPFVAPVTTVGAASRLSGFAVSLTGSGMSITGVIQVDQIKATDLSARNARPTGERAPPYIVDDVLDRFAAIFGFETP